MIDTLKPGQQVRCTLVKIPRALAPRKTVERLMWRDPETAKGLRKSQKLRRRNTVVYNRGNRDWVSREKCAKVVHTAVGQTWSMRYRLDLAHDLKNLADCLSIKQG